MFGFGKPERWMFNDVSPDAYGKAMKAWRSSEARARKQGRDWERDARQADAQRQREAHRKEKLANKLLVLQQADPAVKNYESWVERITSVHEDCGEAWNWQEVVDAREPEPPTHSRDREHAARRRLEEFAPSWFDRLFRRVERRREALSISVRQAEEAGRIAYGHASDAYVKAMKHHSDLRALGMRVLSGDPAAYRDAIARLEPFRSVNGVGSDLAFEFPAAGVVAATFRAGDNTIVPQEVTSLLQTGKASTRAMPIGKGHELYQDYVASACLRIAREVLAFLPVERVLVTSLVRKVSTRSGRETDMPILSVIFDRQSLEGLEFKLIDPSDALANFEHRMKFTKSKGFEPVKPFSPGSLAP
jgi:hypothetical protein